MRSRNFALATIIFYFTTLIAETLLHFKLGGMVQYFVFYRDRLLRDVASAQGMVECSDYLRGCGPL